MEYQIARFLITIILLAIAVLMDFKTKKIKNIIPLIGILLGIIFIFFGNIKSLGEVFLVSVLYFFVLFFIPRKLNIREFLGAADIKLYMLIAFLMGMKFSIYAFIYSIFIGSLFLIIFNIKRIFDIKDNIIGFFMLNKNTASKVIDNNKVNIFSPYIFIGTLITYIQLYVLINDWLFVMIA